MGWEGRGGEVKGREGRQRAKWAVFSHMFASHTNMGRKDVVTVAFHTQSIGYVSYLK